VEKVCWKTEDGEKVYLRKAGVRKKMESLIKGTEDEMWGITDTLWFEIKAKGYGYGLGEELIKMRSGKKERDCKKHGVMVVRGKNDPGKENWTRC